MAGGSAITVVCQGQSLELPVHRFAEGTFPSAGNAAGRIMIVAGVHGREHSGIQVAYALIERLEAMSDLHGTIEILPIANPESFAAETRENPVDGKNLGECFSAPVVDERDAGQDEENLGGVTQTEAIARSILSHLEGCSHLLDLHSAGEARYLPHAIFFREQEASSAAAAGLPFALLRRRTREGALVGMLSQAALLQGIPALALELGGGITTWREDLETGIRAVLSLLAYWNYVPSAYGANPTPPGRVYHRDNRSFVRAWEEGAFHPSCEPGQELQKGDRIGTWISLANLAAAPVVALEAGSLIYLRSRCRTHTGDTLAMLLPKDSTPARMQE